MSDCFSPRHSYVRGHRCLGKGIDGIDHSEVGLVWSALPKGVRCQCQQRRLAVICSSSLQVAKRSVPLAVEDMELLDLILVPWQAGVETCLHDYGSQKSPVMCGHVIRVHPLIFCEQRCEIHVNKVCQ